MFAFALLTPRGQNRSTKIRDPSSDTGATSAASAKTQNSILFAHSGGRVLGQDIETTQVD